MTMRVCSDFAASSAKAVVAGAVIKITENRILFILYTTKSTNNPVIVFASLSIVNHIIVLFVNACVNDFFGLR
jgi:hypothetical protein